MGDTRFSLAPSVVAYRGTKRGGGNVYGSNRGMGGCTWREETDGAEWRGGVRRKRVKNRLLRLIRKSGRTTT